MEDARPGQPQGVRSLSVRRFRGVLESPVRDLLVVEEPLEIRYAGQPVATLMRTPGRDRDLALGYLYGEGWIDTPEAVGALALCATTARDTATDGAGEQENGENIADLIPAAGVRPPTGVTARVLPTGSSCGVCGRRTVEEALALRPPVADGRDAPTRAAGGSLEPSPALSPDVLAEFPERLRERQELFARTGALHAAGLFDPRGDLLLLREDIGRHNAVDKVVGAAFRSRRLPLSSHVLQVSGRVSFDIVQRAYRAGIPVVAAVSGVSTLAVELADRVGITLAGFVRGGGFCVYTNPGRFTGGRGDDGGAQ